MSYANSDAERVPPEILHSVRGKSNLCSTALWKFETKRAMTQINNIDVNIRCPFPPDDISKPTQRQLAIAALIQSIWDKLSRIVRRDSNNSVHPNWGLKQSALPPADRWANIFSAIVLDQWVNAFALRSGGLAVLCQGSQGERRAAYVLFMLWTIARFGPETDQNQVRKKPSSINDIPSPHITLIQKWWELSLDLLSRTDVDQQFEDYFKPTFSQVLMDRCIARAAIACQYLQYPELQKIANEHDIEQWANNLSGLSAVCQILQRQTTSEACPTIMITGPTATGKSTVAWGLAKLLGGVTIAADPFQICAIPPIGLGVGLPSHLPPGDVRTCLYRGKIPGNQRPTPSTVADWVTEVVHNAEYYGMPIIIEGGSVRVASALCEREIPSHIIVFNGEARDSEEQIRARISVDKMSAEKMLAEAQSVRKSRLESTWVVKESILYPTLFEVLDKKMSLENMMPRIQSDWQDLRADQQGWFNDLRVRDDVMTLPPSRQSVEDIVRVFEL